ncbi:MAG: Hsp20/alpha crystallin family protein [Planctomycetota bacterium]|jgi:HSP20 family molecular chaperone IbpA
MPKQNEHVHGRGEANGKLLLAHAQDRIKHVFNRLLSDVRNNGFLDCSPDGFGVGKYMDSTETEHEITIKRELPGIDPTELKIGVMGNLLEIRLQKGNGNENENANRNCTKQQSEGFRCSALLPVSVIPDQVDATYKNDILRIKVIKWDASKPKRIFVGSN